MSDSDIKLSWWRWFLPFSLWKKPPTNSLEGEKDARFLAESHTSPFPLSASRTKSDDSLGAGVDNSYMELDFRVSLDSTGSSVDLLKMNLNELASLFSSLPESCFPRRRLYLPKVQKTLVLDLDETLVHSTSKSSRNYDTMIEVLVGKTSCLYYVFKRPFVDVFLKKAFCSSSSI